MQKLRGLHAVQKWDQHGCTATGTAQVLASMLHSFEVCVQAAVMGPLAWWLERLHKDSGASVPPISVQARRRLQRHGRPLSAVSGGLQPVLLG